MDENVDLMRVYCRPEDESTSQSATFRLLIFFRSVNSMCLSQRLSLVFEYPFSVYGALNSKVASLRRWLDVKIWPSVRFTPTPHEYPVILITCTLSHACFTLLSGRSHLTIYWDSIVF